MIHQIITVGLSPAWDITCRGKNPDWGLHINIDKQTITPAGKALNVSKALAWMEQRSTATGLWGCNDYQQMQTAVRSLWPLIKVKMITTTGSTRQNITIVDTAKNKEMHLRSKSRLASPGALRKLKSDLQALVNKNSICVFAGAMPEEKILEDVIQIIKNCHKARAKIVLDTSGPALKKITETGHIWLIKPNVWELGELSGKQIKDNPASLVQAGQQLLDKVEIALISRGKNGAILVLKKGSWEGKCINRKKAISTVGCGDYLLAGFLKGLKNKNDPVFALKTAIKAATAKAWGRTEQKQRPQIAGRIKIKTNLIK